jgi:hypothetical protein
VYAVWNVIDTFNHRVHDDDYSCFQRDANRNLKSMGAAGVYNSDMKRKPRRKIPDHAAPTAAAVARLSGLTISRVYRLRQEGRNDTEIIMGAQQRKQDALRNLPVTPVNGHAAADGILTLSVAQAQEKTWSAKLKELEYLERKGALVPASYIRFWGTNFIVGAIDEMRKVSELTDTLATESDAARVQKILDDWVGRVCEKIHRLEGLWAQTPKEVM